MKKGAKFSGICLLAFLIPLFSSFAADIMSDFDLPESSAKDADLSGLSEKKSRAMGAFLKAYMGKQKKQNGRKNVEEYIQLLKNDPKSKYGLLFFLSEWNLEDENENRLVLELVPVARENPDAYQLNVIAATALARSGKYADAVELLEKSLETFTPDDGERLDIFSCLKATSLLLELYLKDRRLSTAEGLVSRFSSFDNLRNDMQFHLMSADFFMRASALSDNKTWFWFSEGDKDKFLRKTRDSLAKLAESAATQPRQVPELLPAIELFRKTGDTDGAERLILGNLLWNPDDMATIILWAMYLNDSDRPAEALRVWRTAFENNKQMQPNLYFEMGRAALRCRKYSEAANAFEWFLLSNPDNETAIYQLAVAYYETGLHKKALAKLKKIEHTLEGLYLSAMILRGEGRHAEALKKLLEAEALASKDKRKDFLSKSFYLTLAYTSDKAKNLTETEACLLKLLAEHPDDHEIMNFAAYFWADNNKNLAEAEKLVRKALEANPENAAYLDTLAWALYRQGRHAEAWEFLQKTLALEGLVPDAVIADHAGDIQQALGNTKEAVQWWRKALLVHSEDADKPAILKKIKAAQKGKNAGAD